MPIWTTLYRLELGDRHLSPGRTKHQLVDSSGQRDFPPFKTLEICQYEGDAGYYLLYHPESGAGADTWHQCLDDAFHQAEWEFGVEPTDWEREGDK